MATARDSNPAALQPVGEVTQVTGTVVAIGVDGLERRLYDGDTVFAGDLIKTIGPSSVVVALRDGGRFDLGRDAEAMLDPEVYDDDHAALSAESRISVQEIQQAIARGEDPADAAPQPAAGAAGAAGADGSAIDPAVAIERTGREGEVTAGFETQQIPSTEAGPPNVNGELTNLVNAVAAVGTNQNPVAVDDTAQTEALAPLTIAVLDNDTDPDGDPLSLVSAAAVNGEVTANADGTLTYVAPAGFSGDDTVTYVISDGRGGSDTATVTVNVAPPAELVGDVRQGQPVEDRVGAADEMQAATRTTVIEPSSLGLAAEYYGYNDRGGATGGLVHADDGTRGNLDGLDDLFAIINGRSGAEVVGTLSPGDADATYTARVLDYGKINDNLGTGTSLQDFLGGDAGSLSVDPGDSSDGILRIFGYALFEGGAVDLRVRSDDGFQIRLGDQLFGNPTNHAPTTDIFNDIEPGSGLQEVEILYWEQGGRAVLDIDYKPAGAPDSDYQSLGSGPLGLFTPGFVDTLGPTQEVIADPAQPGEFLIIEGEALSGDAGPNVLLGSEYGDLLDGAGGSDALYGQGGNDILIYDSLDSVVDGGEGEDTLLIDGAVAGLGESVSNVENIDTAIAPGDDALNLSLSDVLNVTDADDVLIVEGGAGDSLTLQSADGWSQIVDMAHPDYRDGYALYEAGGAKLYVDDQVSVDLVP